MISEEKKSLPRSRLRWLAFLIAAVSLYVLLPVGDMALYSYRQYLRGSSAEWLQQQLHYCAYDALRLLELRGRLTENSEGVQNLAQLEQAEWDLNGANTAFRYCVTDENGSVLATNALTPEERELFSNGTPRDAVVFRGGRWAYRYQASDNTTSKQFEGGLNGVVTDEGDYIRLYYVNLCLFGSGQEEKNSFSYPAADRMEQYLLWQGGIVNPHGQLYIYSIDQYGVVYRAEADDTFLVELGGNGALAVYRDGVRIYSESDFATLYAEKYSKEELEQYYFSEDSVQWQGANYRLHYLLVDTPGEEDSLLGANIAAYNQAQSTFRRSLIAALVSGTTLLISFLGLCYLSIHQQQEGPALWGLHSIPYDLFTLGAAVLCATGLVVESVTYLIPLLVMLWVYTTIVRVWTSQLMVNTVVGLLLRTLRVILYNFDLLWKIWTAFGLYFLVSFGLGMVSPVLGILLSWLVGVITLIGISIWLVYFKRLTNGMDRLATGDFEGQVPTDAPFRELTAAAQSLNRSREGLMQAVENQTRSDRMRTELITNVSHDIKTPLTSIVNYADLLQRAATEQERQECLGVINRQSNRLKKLINDLVEASKASTGSIRAELGPVNLGELVEQATGEYAGRMEAAGLALVAECPTPAPVVLADGQLLWRSLDNLLSNAAKYSLPGTRVYLDVAQDGPGWVCLSLKNISSQPLHITADELMERFVRGDSSRHTEGSGLGLNITQSLVQLQGGSFALEIDGDLFKAAIRLPAALQ